MSIFMEARGFSAGLSRLAFGTWFAASLLITIHAVASGAVVFVVLGAIQLVATTLVLVYTTKYQHSTCWSHSPGGVEPPPGSVHTHGGPAPDGANWPAHGAAGDHAVLVAGTLVDGRHEIDQLVGRGRTAEMLRARDITTGRTVAIKILRAVGPESVSRFRTEREALSRLDHPGARPLSPGSTTRPPHPPNPPTTARRKG